MADDLAAARGCFAHPLRALEKGRWKYFGYCILFSLIVLWAAWKGY
jgi:hypothetical protein